MELGTGPDVQLVIAASLDDLVLGGQCLAKSEVRDLSRFSIVRQSYFGGTIVFVSWLHAGPGHRG